MAAPAEPAALAPLRDVIARHGLGARKALGQNFLLDLNLTARIVRAAGDLAGVAVIEIGPGPGGVTRALVATNARAIIAIERDPRCVAALADLVEAASGRLVLIEADALAVDLGAVAEPPRAVVANLPYNIATPLLIGWLRCIGQFVSLTLMFQREVADRIVAEAGTKAYGRLSVMSQWRAEVRPLLNVPARAFTPPPKVDSTLVRLAPRTVAEPAEWNAMEKVVAVAFGQRRKMLRASLRGLGVPPEPLIAAAGLDPTARAEEVPVAGFAALARAWAALGAPAAPPPRGARER